MLRKIIFTAILLLSITGVLTLALLFQGCAVRMRPPRRTAVGITIADNRPPPPGPNYWWDGTVWVVLPPAPPHTVWVPGHSAPDGTWVVGYFKYIGPVAEGKVWVVGHWEGHTWVPGYFRTAVNRGHVWVPGHYAKGRWVRGRWKAVR
jgi:hypothetical protein